MNNTTSRNRKYLKKRGSSVLSHVLASHQKEERRLEDDLVRQTVQEIEADDSWKHPISNNILGSMRIFNAITDPVLRRTGDWVLPEEPDDIPVMYESYLHVLTVYYSLVGVLSAEMGLSMNAADPETTPKLYQYINLVSRVCFVANTTWSFGAVVSAFHLLWALHATPAHVRRRFVLENPHQFSAIYSMGAPNFFLTLVATGTGAIAHAAEQPDADIGVPAILGGIIFGFLITVYLAVTGGSLLAKSMRPWKQAFLKVESLGSQDQEKQEQESSAASAKPPISNEIIDRIESAGLTMSLLKELNDEVLLEKLLVDAGVESPGDRVRVILAVRELGDDVPKRMSVKNLQRYDYETWQD